MRILIANIQDQIKPIDTVGVDTSKIIKATKLIPIMKINSEDGAIIPREAIRMVKLQPAMPAEEKEKDTALPCYITSGIIVLVVIICTKIILNRIKASSK